MNCISSVPSMLSNGRVICISQVQISLVFFSPNCYSSSHLIYITTVWNHAQRKFTYLYRSKRGHWEKTNALGCTEKQTDNFSPTIKYAEKYISKRYTYSIVLNLYLPSLKAAYNELKTINNVKKNNKNKHLSGTIKWVQRKGYQTVLALGDFYSYLLYERKQESTHTCVSISCKERSHTSHLQAYQHTKGYTEEERVTQRSKYSCKYVFKICLACLQTRLMITHQNECFHLRILLIQYFDLWLACIAICPYFWCTCFGFLHRCGPAGSSFWLGVFL